MDSAQSGTSGVTGPVTRKRRQLVEQEEKRRKKEVRKNTKTNFIEVDKSTGKIKTEVKQEPEEEHQNVVVVKEEVEVPMDNASGAGDEDDLGGFPEGFQESTGAESPTAAEGRDVGIGAHLDAVKVKGDLYPGCQQSSRMSVEVETGTDLLASHYVPLVEFNKLKEEMRREKEESDKRFKALEAGFQALQRQLEVNSTLTPKGDQPEVDTVNIVQEEEPGSALMDTEKLNDSSDADLEVEIDAKKAVEVAGIEAPGAVIPTSSTGGNCTEPEDDRTLTLFPEVMEVIWDKYKYSVFNKADFLKCRLICSTWKKGMDEIDNYHAPPPCQCFKIKRDITLLNGQFLWKDGKRREFRYDPDSQGIILDSPVQPTKLTIEDAMVETTREERAQCRRSIEEFLREHGHAIKKFTCEMVKHSPQFENKEDMQRTFNQWLNLMPNLENFDFSSWDEFSNQFIEPDQFPTLPKVKFLEDVNCPLELFKTAVFKNPQINCLKVHWVRNLNFKDVVLPQLKELDLYHQVQVYDLNLLLVPELHAPLLATLRIGTLNTKKYPKQVEAVYAVLNKFRENLQLLQIRVETGDQELVFPDMSRLKTLMFENDGDFYEFDVSTAVKNLMRLISSRRSLENLLVAAPSRRYWDQDPRGLNEIRKQLKAELFSKLKLWEAFPNLKRVVWIYPFYADGRQRFDFDRIL